MTFKEMSSKKVVDGVIYLSDNEHEDYKKLFNFLPTNEEDVKFHGYIVKNLNAKPTNKTTKRT